MEAKYKKIKHAIKSKILEGLINPHEKISSESELMKKFSVSRHTVRLAIGELVNEGWLYREQGAGTFCADRANIESNKRTNKTQKNIAIVTTFISEYIFPSIIRGAESYLSENGYHVSIFNTHNEYEKERQILTTLLTGNYDGVIIEPTNSASANPNLNYYLQLENMNKPFVMINAVYDELEPISFMLDDVQGGFLQTEHLIQLGHQNIVCMHKTDDSQGQKRLKGYIKAHRKYNVPIDPKNIVTYNTLDEMTKPVEELEKILSRKINCPTGLVGYNDQLILNVMQIIRDKDLSVPKDISVVGYDDSPLAELSEVKFTSVKHPKSQLGLDAAKAIVKMVENQQPGKIIDIKSITYVPELNIRQSTSNFKSGLIIS
ncbi:GntR family transcriptional regulator [Saliterribacillus persicus]|uniref:GntR family transcriptional regulator n=1 Tax=Saliterribacillus persicus TaxID=930114 RepID=UPI000DF19E5B|nr:GntR family transcriptional regulator [Saliterribacillus persicus]